MYWKLCRKTLLEHKNEKIRQIMGVKSGLMKTIRETQLRWYGHTHIMKQRIPLKAWKSKPAKKERKGP